MQGDRSDQELYIDNLVPLEDIADISGIESPPEDQEIQHGEMALRLAWILVA